MLYDYAVEPVPAEQNYNLRINCLINIFSLMSYLNVFTNNHCLCLNGLSAYREHTFHATALKKWMGHQNHPVVTVCAAAKYRETSMKRRNLC